MAGSKPGERRGGRQKGARNKATIEREHRALEALKETVKAAPLKKLSKDKLAELTDVSLEVVGIYQKAAMKDGAAGHPGGMKHKPAIWTGLMQAIELARRVCDAAADYESPKFRAMAVAMTPPPPPPSDDQRMIEHVPEDEHDRERVANNAYLRLVKG